MFDIGFWELALCAVIALLVVGPDRLPGLARTVGAWVGKTRRFLSVVKADVERELKADELRRIVEEQARNTGVHEILEDTKSSLDEARRVLEDSALAEEERLPLAKTAAGETPQGGAQLSPVASPSEPSRGQAAETARTETAQTDPVQSEPAQSEPTEHSPRP